MRLEALRTAACKRGIACDRVFLQSGLPMSLPFTKKEQVLQAVLDRASTDKQFRHALLDEPKLAIQSAFGVQIPPTFRVRFIERDPNVDALIVLPDFQSVDGELSEADLETIAGGAGSPDASWSSENGPGTVASW